MAWHPLNDAKFKLMNEISTHVFNFDQHHPGWLPDLRQGDELLITSDYGGDTRDHSYHVYSFVLLNRTTYLHWNEDRLRVREETGLDNRTMAYNRMNDVFRRRALEPFLTAAGRFAGVSITFLLDKRLPSMFDEERRLDFSRFDLAAYSHWDRNTFEKLLRIIHFVSFITAGLSGRGQTVR